MDGCKKTKKRGWLTALKIDGLIFLILVLAVATRLFIAAPEVEVHDEDLLYYPEPVPDEQNAFFHVNSLLQGLESNNISLNSFSWCDGEPSEEGMVIIAELAEENPKLLESFSTLAQYDHYQIPFDEEAPLYSQDIFSSWPISPLISLSGYSLHYIEFLMRAGRLDEATSCLQAHAYFGHMIQKDSYALVSGMIGAAVRGRAVSALQQNLLQGRFEFKQCQVIQDVIDMCLDDDVWAHMFQAEYMFSKEIIEDLDTGAIYNDDSPVEKLPLMLDKLPGLYSKPRTLQRFGSFYNGMVSACYDPNAEVPEVAVFQGFRMVRAFFSGNCVGELLFQIGTPSVASVVKKKWEQDAQAELIKLYVAVWEYYDDNGMLPGDLTQLVPAYISELPRDPFGTGGSFLYEPESKEIYSAGIDQSEKKLKGLTMSLGFVD